LNASGSRAILCRKIEKVVAFLLLLLLIEGCPSKPAPGVRFPITHGSHAILPTTAQRILIWGDPPLAGIAVEWLLAHRYTSLLRPDPQPLQASHIAHTFSTRAAALAVAREMKAEMVLFLDQEVTKDGALIETDCGTRFHVTVEVRGLSVESGDAALRGKAYYPHCVDLSDKTIRSLTCQAFATAWGFRPSGQLDIPSNLMCTAGQTEPIPIR
jgi:hypothetical protein